jgi:hypothetical protein
VRARDERGPRPDRVRDRGEGRHPHLVAAPLTAGRERAEQPGVLLVRGQNLVARPQVERVQHHVHAVGGGARECHLVGAAAQQAACDLPAEPLAEPQQRLEMRLPAAPLVALALDLGGGGVRAASGGGALGSGVQVGEPRQHWELGAEGGGVHLTILSSSPP